MPNSRNLFETIRVNINAPEVPALTEEGRFWLNNLPSTTSFSKETITQLTFSLSVKVPHYNSALFRPEIYAKILPMAKAMHSVENKGIPEEHAYKLAVLFDDEKKAEKYIATYAKAHPDSESLLYDACLFGLPQDGFDLRIWRKLAQKFLLRQDGQDTFRKHILPQAVEIERVIKKNASTVKPDPKVIKTVSESIDSLNREVRKLAKQHDNLDEEEELVYQQKAKELSDKRLALANLGLPFNDQLTLTALRAFKEQVLADSSATYRYFLSNGLTEKDFEKFKKLNRQDNDIEIPPITINGADFDMAGYYLKKVPVLDEAEAARAACFGKLTNCCQSLSGEAGEPCCIHGLTSPYGGFYVLCEGDVNNPKVSDKVMGQTWAWRSKENAIVFDSVEIGDQNEVTLVRLLYQYLADELVRKGHTHKVVCGADSGISHTLGIRDPNPILETFKDYDNYNDSKNQRTLIDKNRPYIYHKSSLYAEELTVSFLKSIFADPTKIMQNPEFSILCYYHIYYDLLVNRDTDDPNPLKTSLLLNELIDSCPFEVQKEINALFKKLADFYKSRLTNPELKALIEQCPYFLNAINISGNTPLFSGNVETCKMLLDKGAIVNLTNHSNKTALDWVLLNLKRAPFVQVEEHANLLLDHGANFSHWSSFNLAMNGSEELALRMIDLPNIDALYIANCYIWKAIALRHARLASKMMDILRYHPDFIQLRNGAILDALIRSDENIAITFIQKGFPCFTRIPNGESFLSFVKSLGLTNVVAELERRQEDTILSAIENNNYDFISSLDSVDIRDLDETVKLMLLFHLVSNYEKFPNRDACQSLISCILYDTHLTGNNEFFAQTAIYACLIPDIDYNPFLNKLKNANFPGHEPIDVDERYTCENKMDFLEAICQQFPHLINQPFVDDSLPIDVIAAHSSSSILNLLLKFGLDINHKDNLGNNVLDTMFLNHDKVGFQLFFAIKLVESGIEVNENHIKQARELKYDVLADLIKEKLEEGIANKRPSAITFASDKKEKANSLKMDNDVVKKDIHTDIKNRPTN